MHFSVLHLLLEFSVSEPSGGEKERLRFPGSLAAAGPPQHYGRLAHIEIRQRKEYETEERIYHEGIMGMPLFVSTVGIGIYF